MTCRQSCSWFSWTVELKRRKLEGTCALRSGPKSQWIHTGKCALVTQDRVWNVIRIPKSDYCCICDITWVKRHQMRSFMGAQNTKEKQNAIRWTNTEGERSPNSDKYGRHSENTVSLCTIKLRSFSLFQKCKTANSSSLLLRSSLMDARGTLIISHEWYMKRFAKTKQQGSFHKQIFLNLINIKHFVPWIFF